MVRVAVPQRTMKTSLSQAPSSHCPMQFTPGKASMQSETGDVTEPDQNIGVQLSGPPTRAPIPPHKHWILKTEDGPAKQGLGQEPLIPAQVLSKPPMPSQLPPR